MWVSRDDRSDSFRTNYCSKSEFEIRLPYNNHTDYVLILVGSCLF